MDRRPEEPVLDYARPGAQDEPAARAAFLARSRSKYICAVGFAAVALSLGILFTARGSSLMYKSGHRLTDTAERKDWRDGMRFVAIGIVLIGPALWYGGVGLRGLLSRGDDASDME